MILPRPLKDGYGIHEGETMTKHDLRKKIGEWFVDKYKNDSNVQVIRDSACNSKQRISLFSGEYADNGRAANICNVDLLVIKDNKIAIVVGIEESDIKPNQIYDKFLTVAHSDYFSHRKQDEKSFFFRDMPCFIQVLDDSKLDELKIDKAIQGRNIINTVSKKLLDVGAKGRTRFMYKLVYCNINTYKEALENNTM